MRSEKYILTIAGLAAITFLLYAAGLRDSPASLHRDEVLLARQATSIALSARDLDGRPLPLFVHAEGELWFQPIPVYTTALALTLASSSVASVRAPSVVVGALDVCLIYLIGLRLFRQRWLPLAAAGLLLLAPAHFMSSRLAMEFIYAVPFALAWLLCLLSFLDRPRPVTLFTSGLCLGVGFYSQSSAPIMMTMYLLLTALVLHAAGHLKARSFLGVALGFLLPLLCLLPWFLWNPDSYRDTLGRWAIHAAHLRNPADGVRAFLNWGTLTNRATVYWEFLNPAFLFFPAESSTVMVTRGAGVLLLPVGLLLPIGVNRIVRVCAPATCLALLFGIVLAPLAAASFGEQHAVGRALPLVPFAALIATFGLMGLLEARRPVWRVTAIVLLALVPIQFAFFHHDYFLDYRDETAEIFRSAR